MPAATTTVPPFVRRHISPWEWRHARGLAIFRVCLAAWLALLGSLLCGVGQWWGALCFLAAAVAGYAAYQVPRWKRALDAEGDDPVT